MNSCKQLILSDINRYNIFGSGVVRIFKKIFCARLQIYDLLEVSS